MNIKNYLLYNSKRLKTYLIRYSDWGAQDIFRPVPISKSKNLRTQLFECLIRSKMFFLLDRESIFWCMTSGLIQTDFIFLFWVRKKVIRF